MGAALNGSETYPSLLRWSWGLPQQRMPDGQGGEIWTYFEPREWATPGQATTTTYGTTNASGTSVMSTLSYQLWRLDDASSHDVLENFPTESELRELGVNP